ncbi:MAG TPA: D-arabinose 5-phosphate isomerase, partial [Chryseolinea sp.]|nr:D-arabinose 5-phosphate isomerase [Chryseolinea sp.]
MNLVKNIKKIACEVLINESQAIQQLADYIDDDFEACVKEIYSAKGRVVVTGIGKSAIVANKIV